MDAHTAARGAPSGACAEGGPSVSRQGEAMLLMVEHRGPGITETVLRSLDQLQPGGTVKHNIPYRWGCSYALFQGEPAKFKPALPEHIETLNLCLGVNC